MGGLGEGASDGKRFAPKWATPSLGGPHTDTETEDSMKHVRSRQSHC